MGVVKRGVIKVSWGSEERVVRGKQKRFARDPYKCINRRREGSALHALCVLQDNADEHVHKLFSILVVEGVSVLREQVLDTRDYPRGTVKRDHLCVEASYICSNPGKRAHERQGE
jgi:hypothetical protein